MSGEYFDGFATGGGVPGTSLLAHRTGVHARTAKLRRTGRHTRAARLAMFPVVMLLTLALSAFIMIAKPGKAGASAVPGHLAAFFWARSQAGKPYIYGAAGPGGFDCSGLVFSAYRAEGISLPRTTFGMLAAVATGELIPESSGQARKGDLAFFGSGHVELVARQDHTFGALQAGTLIGWHSYSWSSWWHPSLFFRVRGAG